MLTINEDLIMDIYTITMSFVGILVFQVILPICGLLWIKSWVKQRRENQYERVTLSSGMREKYV